MGITLSAALLCGSAAAIRQLALRGQDASRTRRDGQGILSLMALLPGSYLAPAVILETSPGTTAIGLQVLAFLHGDYLDYLEAPKQVPLQRFVSPDSQAASFLFFLLTCTTHRWCLKARPCPIE